MNSNQEDFLRKEEEAYFRVRVQSVSRTTTSIQRQIPGELEDQVVAVVLDPVWAVVTAQIQDHIADRIRA